jgi:hypothetical protein
VAEVPVQQQRRVLEFGRAGVFLGPQLQCLLLTVVEFDLAFFEAEEDVFVLQQAYDQEEGFGALENFPIVP